MTPPACRLCGARLHRSLMDLGATPLATCYLTQDAAARGEDRAYPLHARVCDSCLLVQVEEVVPAEQLFAGNAPFASYSVACVERARRYAGAMIERFGLTQESLVIEVASNDGYLLQHFRAAGIPVLGIEPASNVAAAARDRGIPTEGMFLNAETAMQLAAQHGRADLVVANDVLTHVPDLFGFAAGFIAILRPRGVVSFEFPHLLSLIEQAQFDAIAHEQFSYLSLLVVEHVLRSVGLRVFDVERLPTHGGSLRVFACQIRGPYPQYPSVKAIRRREAAAGIDRPDSYDSFAPKVAHTLRTFRAFIAAQHEAGRRTAAYGAAAQGNTFLNCCGITSSDILCVADRDPARQGRLMPGSRVPIVPPETMRAAGPDDVVILPWDQDPEIAEHLQEWRNDGMRVWTASPDLRRV